MRIFAFDAAKDNYQIGIEERETDTLFSGSPTSLRKSVDPNGIPFFRFRARWQRILWATGWTFPREDFVKEKRRVVVGPPTVGRATADKQNECNRLTGGGSR